MMGVGKLCGMAVIIVITIPIILGMVWPDGTQEVDVWDVEPGLDITGDIANRPIPIWDTYTGPLNNLTFYDYNLNRIEFPTPRETTTVPNAYPISTRETPTTESSVVISDLATSGKARYIILTSGNGLSITGDTDTYHFGDYWPATNTLVLYQNNALETVPVKTITPKLDDVLSGTMLITAFSAPTGYMDASTGLISPATPGFWANGMQNKAIDVWVRIQHTAAARFYFDLLQITWDGDAISITDGTTTAALGSIYDYISIRLDSDGKATVTGLIGVDSFLDRTYTEGNSIELESSGHLDYIPLLGTYADYWVVSTTSAIGSTTGINGSAFSPESYYGTHSWQAQIINPSTFGTDLQIAVGGSSADYPISSGSITVTNLDTGETSAQAIREMRILSLVFDNTQTIYINGIPALRETAANSTITLNGNWLAAVVVSKVTQTTSTEYTWDLYSFGFDQTAFCVVGLLSCASVMIIGSLWGRRSGESVLALFVTMIICGIAFYCLI